MNILCVGDVIGGVGLDFLTRHLPSLKRLKGIQLVIANGENAADTNGITPTAAERLFATGVDCITTGNHSFQRRESYAMYEGDLPVIRPANYPESGVPGRGFTVIDKGLVRVGVINLMGLVSMPEPLECPFRTADRILASLDTKINIIDFHAEATSEKRALAMYLDGRVTALFGTHTHVQTADEQVLPGGTGFITDAGMTGPIHSVIGCKPEPVIARFMTRMPARLEYADGPCMINAVLFHVDTASGKTISAERIRIE